MFIVGLGMPNAPGSTSRRRRKSLPGKPVELDWGQKRTFVTIWRSKPDMSKFGQAIERNRATQKRDMALRGKFPRTMSQRPAHQRLPSDGFTEFTMARELLCHR